MSEEYAAIFKEEATELLAELESALLELEENPEDLNIVSRVFRAMHTIKGSGAMFGFDNIAEFTHHVETVLDKVREGQIRVSKDLINLILASRDHIASMLEAASGKGAVAAGRGDEIIRALTALSGHPAEGHQDPAPKKRDSGGNKATEQRKTVPAKGKEPLVHYRIVLKPSPDFFASGLDADTILAELEQLGECTVIDRSEGSRDEYLSGKAEGYWKILLITSQDVNAIRDVFLFAENTAEILISELGEENELDFPEHQKIGEILMEQGDVDKEKLQQVLTSQSHLGQLLVDGKIVSPAKVDAALKEQRLMAQKREMKSQSASSIKVGADKLDHLINLVGEMVVTQARLTQASLGIDNNELIESVEEVERFTSELRDCVLNIRMLPIGTTFVRFKRLVRDLAGELGKEADLVTEGAQTELDKSVIEQIGDPLVHLIRNSIDHGIESPEERLAAGKPRRGTIKLAAIHSGSHVVITVEDDGKGLDAGKIRQKAIQKGLLAPEAALTEAEVFDLIFGAGVSTAENVTDVSGRGVGMDVVKTTIEGRLKGSVKVKSRLGKGSTVTISLPLTLAIIDGLLVKAGATHLVLPLPQVEECFELTREDIAAFHGRHIFPVRGHLIPYVQLREFFQIPGKSPGVQQMVIVNINGERVGLVLDSVIGSHQTVIKSLGWVYRNAEGISGATILGNGEVALIVDIANLIRYAQSEERAS